MPPFTATASCLASGLHASASTWGKRELTRRGATVDGDGEALGFVLGDAVEPGVRDGEGKTGLRLTGSMIAPWSGSDRAAIVPSALNAIGPSSGPGASGKWLSTPSCGFRKYHAPVAKPRTAISPSIPGPAP